MNDESSVYETTKYLMWEEGLEDNQIASEDLLESVYDSSETSFDNHEIKGLSNAISEWHDSAEFIGEELLLGAAENLDNYYDIVESGNVEDYQDELSTGQLKIGFARLETAEEFMDEIDYKFEINSGRQLENVENKYWKQGMPENHSAEDDAANSFEALRNVAEELGAEFDQAVAQANISREELVEDAPDIGAPELEYETG
jgi:hypothetical protein